MAKWCVEFHGEVEIEAETEEEATKCAWDQLGEDPSNVLMIDVTQLEEDEDAKEEDDAE